MTQPPRKISEYVRNHYVTPSGISIQRYLCWAKEVVDVDHILMSTDYAFEIGASGAARAFLEDTNLSDEVKVKIAPGNWERLRAVMQG